MSTRSGETQVEDIQRNGKDGKPNSRLVHCAVDQVGMGSNNCSIGAVGSVVVEGVDASAR